MKKLRDMEPHEEETMVSFDTQDIYPLLLKRKIQSVEEVGVYRMFHLSQLWLEKLISTIIKEALNKLISLDLQVQTQEF